MPVERQVDGTWATGLKPSSVSSDHLKPNGTGLYIDRAIPPLPKNPLLAVTKSRKTRKDPHTGKLLTRSATKLNLLYRPGGLLYKRFGEPE